MVMSRRLTQQFWSGGVGGGHLVSLTDQLVYDVAVMWSCVCCSLVNMYEIIVMKLSIERLQVQVR